MNNSLNLSNSQFVLEAETGTRSAERLRNDLRTALAFTASALRRFQHNTRFLRLRAHAFRSLGLSSHFFSSVPLVRFTHFFRNFLSEAKSQPS